MLKALPLLEVLLMRCQRSASWIALPYLRRVLHELLEYCADDEQGRDCGAGICAHAASILGRMPDVNRKQLRMEDLVRPDSVSHAAILHIRGWSMSGFASALLLILSLPCLQDGFFPRHHAEVLSVRRNCP